MLPVPLFPTVLSSLWNPLPSSPRGVFSTCLPSMKSVSHFLPPRSFPSRDLPTSFLPPSLPILPVSVLLTLHDPLPTTPPGVREPVRIRSSDRVVVSLCPGSIRFESPVLGVGPVRPTSHPPSCTVRAEPPGLRVPTGRRSRVQRISHGVHTVSRVRISGNEWTSNSKTFLFTPVAEPSTTTDGRVGVGRGPGSRVTTLPPPFLRKG